MTSNTLRADAPVETVMAAIGAAARAAAARIADAPGDAKALALRQAAKALRDSRAAVLDANRRDLALGRDKGLAESFLDRLALDDRRIEGIAAGIEAVAALPDPVGRVTADWTRPNGLHIQRVQVPIGVLGIIFESRPNVTADAGALALKAGNAAILRGGSESFASSQAIHAALVQGLAAAGLPEAAVQLVPTRDRAAVGIMLGMAGVIDVIVPRGGKSLTARVMAESRVPVLAHLDGNCHTYVDGAADLAKARAIVVNAKMRRVSVCGATETLLVDAACAATHLPAMAADLIAAGCALRGDAAARRLVPGIEAAVEADWDTEFLDAVLAVKVVDGVAGAIAHIAAHGSHHTDAIVTEDAAAAERFLREVDSAIVLVNASTQFADGGEFGMGAEIGIATGRLHARGPVGAEQLTTFKYAVRGSGQIRP